MAGWWLGCVSLPLFQFLLLRWYFRLFVWARFLWQVSRIEVEAHARRIRTAAAAWASWRSSATRSRRCCWPRALLAGMMANRIFYTGAKLPDFKVELIGLVALMVFAVLGPLLVFSPKLEAAKRAGLREYGALAQRYVREFDRKWLRGGAAPDEPLVGSADIQSLADLGNSFDVVKEMRLVPFTLPTVAAAGRDDAGARAAADVDDDLPRGIARAPAQDRVLRSLPAPPVPACPIGDRDGPRPRSSGRHRRG